MTSRPRPHVQASNMEASPNRTNMNSDLGTSPAHDQIPSITALVKRELMLYDNLSKLPEMDPALIAAGGIQYQKTKKCPKCRNDQFVRRQCPKCGVNKYFACFPTRCYSAPAWRNWTCRRCREDSEPIPNIPDPPAGEKNISIAWLQQEKTKRFQANCVSRSQLQGNQANCPNCLTKVTVNKWTCFNCYECKDSLVPESARPDWIDSRRMDVTWFCHRCQNRYNICPWIVENYCYLCRSPQPVTSGVCKRCGKFYRFDCLYPFKCIGTRFNEDIGNDRWNHCTKCLEQMEFVHVEEDFSAA